MRKIILILLLVFSLNIKVEALEYDIYYSNYGAYSNFSEEKIDGSDVVDVEIERRYKWYEETESGEFLLYDDGINKYDFVNTNEYKLTDFNSWQVSKPEFAKGRTVEERTRYKVSYIKPINMIYISNVDLKKEKVDFGNIEIYSNDKKIGTKIFCSDCEDGLNLYNESGFIMVELDNYYYMEDLIIKIISSEVSNINSFNVFVTAPNGIDSQENVFFTANYVNSGNNIVINKDSFKVTNPIYEESVIYDYIPSVTTFDLVEEIKEYRFQDKLYYFYTLNREYLDGYYIKYEGYEKDEKQYKDFYRYRTRDKIEVAKEIVITNYNNKLEDYIYSTSDYKVETNINYEENGMYYVDYITSFKTIRKEIVVDIVENELKQELQEIIDKYNKLIDDYNVSEKEKENLKKRYEQTVKDYNELLNKYDDKQNEIIGLNVKNEEISNNYNELLNTYNKKVNDNETLNTKYQNIDNSYNTLLNNYNKILSDHNHLNAKHQNLILDYDLNKNHYDDLLKINADKYLELSNENSGLKADISTLKSEYNLCLTDLDNMILKNNDNEKKLKLSNQANDYLRESLLKIDNDEVIENVSFIPFLFLGLLVLIIVIIFLKKKSNKNKF